MADQRTERLHTVRRTKRSRLGAAARATRIDQTLFWRSIARSNRPFTDCSTAARLTGSLRLNGTTRSTSPSSNEAWFASANHSMRTPGYFARSGATRLVASTTSPSALYRMRRIDFTSVSVPPQIAESKQTQ